MKVLISAAETSSDLHGAELLKSLHEIAASEGLSSIEAFGVGGPKLKAAGLKTVVDSKDLLAMGTWEVLGRIPQILRSLKKMVHEAEQNRPDVAVVIDYPDFHFRLTRKIRKLGIPVIYYIPPKIWVWRKSRIFKIKKYFQKVLCIFPFEEKIYRDALMPVEYIGNPLLDELPLGLSKEEARQKLGVSLDQKILVLMPGSRPSELKNHFSLMLDSAHEFCRRQKESFLIWVVLPESVDPSLYQEQAKRWPDLEIRITSGAAANVLAAADLGLIKSGTSTLEAALMGCPHVIVYRPAWITGWLFQNVVGYRDPVGLSNLVLQRKAKGQLPFPEQLCAHARVPEIVESMLEVFSNPDQTQMALQKVKEQVFQKDAASPSHRGAKAVIEYGKRQLATPGWAAPDVKRRKFFIVGLAQVILSFFWSLVNGVRRFLFQHFQLGAKLGSTVISVGNLQAGGAGKTPVVALLAKRGIVKGQSVAILTRGYRGGWEKQGGILSPNEEVSTELAGDEALLLRELVPEAWIGVGADRVKSYRQICKAMHSKPDWVILDDGFQNFSIQRNFDLLVVTSDTPWDRLFRDFRFQSKNADLVLWSKGPLRPKSYGTPLLKIRFEIARPSQRSPRIWLVTGVGDGKQVFETCQFVGYWVRRHLMFRDHFSYSLEQVQKILQEAAQDGSQVAITGKDWVKWRALGIGKDKVLVLEPEIQLDEDGEEFWNQLSF